MPQHHVLIVDDSSVDLEIISMVCELLGCKADVVSDGMEAIDRYDPTLHDLVLCDYVMEPVNGIYVISQILKLNPNAKCIMVSGFPDVTLRTFTEENQLMDLIVKPIQPQTLKESLRIALHSGEGATAELDGIALSNRMDDFPRLSGDSPETLSLRDQLTSQINSKNVIVLVGPAGSGKKEIAEFMHQNGPHAGGGCITFDCSKYSEEELNSYLIDDTGEFGIQVKRAEQGMLIFTHIHLLPKLYQERLTEHMERLSDRTRVFVLADLPLEDSLAPGPLDDGFYFKIASNTIEVV